MVRAGYVLRVFGVIHLPKHHFLFINPPNEPGDSSNAVLPAIKGLFRVDFTYLNQSINQEAQPFAVT